MMCQPVCTVSAALDSHAHKLARLSIVNKSRYATFCSNLVCLRTLDPDVYRLVWPVKSKRADHE